MKSWWDVTGRYIYFDRNGKEQIGSYDVAFLAKDSDDALKQAQKHFKEMQARAKPGDYENLTNLKAKKWD